MIQLSNLFAASSEKPAKTAGSAGPGTDFAKLFAGELVGEAATPGKTLPVGSEILPVGNDILPVSLPGVALAAKEMPADLAPTKPTIGKALVLESAVAAPDAGLTVSETKDAKGEPPRIDATPIAASKAVAAELKIRVRAERQAMAETANAPVEAQEGEEPAAPLVTKPAVEDKPAKPSEKALAKGDAKEAVEQAGAAAVDLAAQVQTLPLEAAHALVAEQPAPPASPGAVAEEEDLDRPASPGSQPSRAAAKPGAARPAALAQDPVADHPATPIAQAIAAANGASVGGSREAPRQGTVPEFRFDLTKDADETAALGEARPREPVEMRVDRAASAQNRTQPGLHAQLSITEPAALHAHGDLSSAASTTNASPAGSPATPSQTLRPHEFTALVDRLVEARETARAGSVNVSVMHADFGQVSLRFSHDGGALSVSMSNSDPEFARAVGAAAQADGAQTGDGAAQNGRRDDPGQSAAAFTRSGGGAAGSQTSGDANATGGGRQQAQHDPRADRPGAQGRTAMNDERAERDGIYA